MSGPTLPPNLDTLPPQGVLAASPAGSWMLLVPAGVSQGRDGRGPFDTGGPAEMRAIIERTKARARATELMVDYDHQAMFAAVEGVGGTAKASGWIKDYRVTARGIEGRVEWTAAARAAIHAREYRYLSPVFNHDREGRIQSLHSVGLVNVPNFDLEAVAHSASHRTRKPRMEKIAKALGLAEIATEDEIVAAIGALTSSDPLKPDPAKFVPMSAFLEVQVELNKTRSGFSQKDAEREVETLISAGKVLPASREWAVNLCQTNKAAFDGFVSQIAPVVQSLLTPQFGERGDRAPSAHSQTRRGDASEIHAKLGLSAEDVQKHGRS